MVCYHPIQGYRAPGGQVAFTKRQGYVDRPITIPCGQCTGCRLEKSRQWAMRIMHEASLYDQNVFLTLTYRDEELPEHHSLNVRHWQLFMKRLKKRYGGRKIRFYHCGEYGETTHRPHYHAILFGMDFEDKKVLKQTDIGHFIYTSEKLDQIWGHGDCYIGSVTFESAAYCGRYCMKKLTGSRASEYGSREPEYSTQSRNPGIGKPWLEKWKTDVYPNDYCVMNGKRVKVPKYYDRFVEDEAPFHYEYDENKNIIFVGNIRLTDADKRRGTRARNARKHSHNSTPDRLEVREIVQKARLGRLTRS